MAEDRFDDLAKGLASGRMSRRGALRSMGAGLAGALAAVLLPSAAHAAPCPEGQQKCGGAGCCPEGTVCCKVQGAHFCCETGGLVNVGCPSTIARAVSLGCIRIG